MAWGRVNTGGVAASGLPNFTYTGTYTLIDDGDKNWRIKFLTSGTFTPEKDVTIDVFCVGGGGGGCNSNWQVRGGGGGGGYTHTENSVVLAAGSYEITVGAGGSAGVSGGTSSFGSMVSANGGGSAFAYAGQPGGSGGGASGANGGTDGGNGASNGSYPGGLGQGTTTREFGEAAGTLYASGGTGKAKTSAFVNTGDGGGGSDGAAQNAGSGGSGIVVIRNHREAAA